MRSPTRHASAPHDQLALGAVASLRRRDPRARSTPCSRSSPRRLALAGCGGGGPRTRPTTAGRPITPRRCTPPRPPLTTASAPAPARPVRLVAALRPARCRRPAAGSPPSPTAAACSSPAGSTDGAVSTTTVFRLTASGAVWPAPARFPIRPTTPPRRRSAAASLLFGGGQSEGSDRIEQIAPGPARVIGHLPQALSDLTATTIGSAIYVAGGWNGTDTNRAILAVGRGSAHAGARRTAAAGRPLPGGGRARTGG